MKMWKEKTWRHVRTGVDGNTTLFGVNIFDYEWESTGKRVTVRDPLHGEEYKFGVYTVTIDGQPYEFAAGEFSACVWSFYLEKY